LDCGGEEEEEEAMVSLARVFEMRFILQARTSNHDIFTVVMCNVECSVFTLSCKAYRKFLFLFLGKSKISNLIFIFKKQILLFRDLKQLDFDCEENLVKRKEFVFTSMKIWYNIVI